MKREILNRLAIQCREESTEPIVFSGGNPEAHIMLVGEAPGAKEIELGKPFVGQAGKNLDEFLHILNLIKEDIYITNVVKIRPYKINDKTGRKSNRPPKKDEIEQYNKYLFKEIQIIKPKIIITLGNVPLKVVLGEKNAVIGAYHGKAMDKGAYHVFPLYHPASIIYNQSLRNTYINDLYELKDHLDRLHSKNECHEA